MKHGSIVKGLDVSIQLLLSFKLFDLRPDLPPLTPESIIQLLPPVQHVGISVIRIQTELKRSSFSTKCVSLTRVD